jgi:hypothetical protein
VADEIYTEGQASDVAAMLEELAQLLRVRLEANPSSNKAAQTINHPKEPDPWP